MAVIDMKKVILVGMQKEKEKILKSIQYMGNLEISHVEEQNGEENEEQNHESGDSIKPAENKDPKVLNGLQARMNQVESVLGLLDKYNPVKKGLFETKPQVDIMALSEILASQDETLALIRDCQRLDEQLKNLHLEKTRLNNIIEQVEPWGLLDIPVDSIEDTPTSRLIAGTVDKSAVQRFWDNLKAIGDELVYVQELGETKGEACFFIVYHKSIEEDMFSLFTEFSFSRANFSDLKGAPTHIIKETKKQLRQIEKSQDEIVEKIIEFSSMRDKIELLYDALLIEIERNKALENLMETNHTFILKGWIPLVEAEDFVSTLKKEFKDLYIKLEKPEADEDFPVVLDNPALVTPFETVTNLYSVPNSRELDPNTVMAPFFGVFFGIMMGDAGYGILMAIATYWFLKKMNPGGDTKKLVGVIFIGSIFTFIWGAIFGGWFGNAGELFGVNPLWFNPSDEPIKMLIFCFAAGVIHIFAGIGVKAYVNIREGRILDAIFDQGFWYIFHIGLILWLVGGMANLGVMYSKVGQIMSIGGAIGLIFTQGRDKDNIFSKFFTGLLSLYDVTGFLSDVLSYSRLFALALTTGVIGTVINQLGAMAGSRWYGWIIAIPVLIGGHVFNIAINVLGAFVHTSRLQYIEFYGKFYEGGGKSFNPLRIKTKYTEVKK